MIKIHDFKTGKVREVVLEPGESHYLRHVNLNRMKEQNAKKEKSCQEKD